LADGWSGRIISIERYFSESNPLAVPPRLADFYPVALDGAMILLSMLALNVFHPGRLLQDESAIQEKKNDSVTDV